MTPPNSILRKGTDMLKPIQRVKFTKAIARPKARTKSRSEMPVWTVSQKFCYLQWKRLFKEYGADEQRLLNIDLHLDKFPTPATFACWKITFKTEVCTCSQVPTEPFQWNKGELVDSVDELRSSSSIRGISMSNSKQSMRGLLRHWTQSSIILTWNKRPRQDRFFRVKRIAYVNWEHCTVTGANDSVENYATLSTVGLRNDDLLEFDSKWDGILSSLTKVLVSSWKVCTN